MADGVKQYGFIIESLQGSRHLTDASYIKGGYIVVETIAERDALPVDGGTAATDGIIVDGSLVYVAGTVNKSYRYNGTSWVEESGPSIGALDTTATASQEPSDSQSFGNNIVLHKISKTGKYEDLATKNNAAHLYKGTISKTTTTAVVGSSLAEYNTSSPMATVPDLYVGDTILDTNGTYGRITNWDTSLHAGTAVYAGDELDLPTIPSNVITGSGTSGSITKFNGTNTVTDGPAFGNSTTTFLANDGQWRTPAGTVTLGTLDTNNDAAQPVPTTPESFASNIDLHQISKTGSYTDLLNKPSDGSATIASESNSIVTLKAGVSQSGLTIGNSSGSDIALAKVAKTGSYNDLSNKPTIPTVGTLNTNSTAPLNPSGSESFGNTINLHKISKTGTYADLQSIPSFVHLYNGDISKTSSTSVVASNFAEAGANSLDIPVGDIVLGTNGVYGKITSWNTSTHSGSVTYVDELTVDNALSSTSTNPVQNKVVKEELDKKITKEVISVYEDINVTPHTYTITSPATEEEQLDLLGRAYDGEVELYLELTNVDTVQYYKYSAATYIFFFGVLFFVNLMPADFDTTAMTYTGVFDGFGILFSPAAMPKIQMGKLSAKVPASYVIANSSSNIDNQDALGIFDNSTNELKKSSITFDGSTTTQFLSKKGSWESIPSGPMVFKGTVGDSGAIATIAWTTLLSSSTIVAVGDTYKVVSARSTDAPVCKVGDTIICTSGGIGSSAIWTVIPSGNDVTNVATGTGLTGGPITSTGTISHGDTSSQASVDNSGVTFIQDVTLDDFGHVTGLGSKTITKSDITGLGIPESDTNTTYSLSGALSSHKFTSTLTAGGSGSGTSTSDITLVAGSNVSLVDNTSERKITISATDTNNTYALDVNGSGDNTTKLGLVETAGTVTTTQWVTIPYATSAGSAATATTASTAGVAGTADVANSVAWANVTGHANGVKTDLGISSSGDASKFLNEQGSFQTVTTGAGAMRYKGTVGDSATITWANLINSSTSVAIGDTYKVVTTRSGSPACKVGDMIIAVTGGTGLIATWAVIPSGDDVTGSGTSGSIAKWNGASSLTDGPAFGSDTTKYLRNDGEWAVPPSGSGNSNIYDGSYNLIGNLYISDSNLSTLSTGKQLVVPTVDSTLDTTSSNAIANSAVATALNGKAASDHVHGNITNDGKIGSTANQAVYTTTDGAVTAGTLPTAATNAAIAALPVWSANPTDSTYLIRQDTGGTNSFGRVPFSTVNSYIVTKNPILNYLAYDSTEEAVKVVFP